MTIFDKAGGSKQGKRAGAAEAQGGAQAGAFPAMCRFSA